MTEVENGNKTCLGVLASVAGKVVNECLVDAYLPINVNKLDVYMGEMRGYLRSEGVDTVFPEAKSFIAHAERLATETLAHLDHRYAGLRVEFDQGLCAFFVVKGVAVCPDRQSA